MLQRIPIGHLDDLAAFRPQTFIDEMTNADVLSGPIAGPSTPRRAPTLNDLVKHVDPGAPLFVAKATLAWGRSPLVTALIGD